MGFPQKRRTVHRLTGSGVRVGSLLPHCCGFLLLYASVSLAISSPRPRASSRDRDREDMERASNLALIVSYSNTAHPHCDGNSLDVNKGKKKKEREEKEKRKGRGRHGRQELRSKGGEERKGVFLPFVETNVSRKGSTVSETNRSPRNPPMLQRRKRLCLLLDDHVYRVQPL